jgi:hypothetical protein
MSAPRAIFGVDFSGAQDAGNKIWIARHVSKGETLLIEKCFRARDLPNSGPDLKSCLPALMNLVKSEANAAFGFDFPFGMPSRLVKERTWEQFVLEFPKKHKSPETFRQACREVSRGRELKRQTDIESRTPFSPYNLRIYKQTYYGIREVLNPLVKSGLVCVVPMQRSARSKPWLLEVCPASMLRKSGLNGLPYKGRAKVHERNRHYILERVKETGPVEFHHPDIESKIIADKGGDALDSVIAALAVFKTLNNNPEPTRPEYPIEGYVY